MWWMGINMIIQTRRISIHLIHWHEKVFHTRAYFDLKKFAVPLRQAHHPTLAACEPADAYMAS